MFTFYFILSNIEAEASKDFEDSLILHAKNREDIEATNLNDSSSVTENNEFAIPGTVLLIFTNTLRF